MTPFQFPKATDAAWVKPLLNAEGLALCNYSFPVLFCWQHAYDFRYAREGDRLLTRLTSSLGHSYLWPVGEGDPKPALDAITQDAREEGQPLRLIALTQYHKIISTTSTAWLTCPARSSTPSATIPTAWTRPIPAGTGPP